MSQHSESGNDPGILLTGLRFLRRFALKILYYLLFGLCWVLAKVFFRFSYERDPQVDGWQGPMLILANHQSYIDPLLVILAMGGRLPHFVAGRDLWESRFVGRLLRLTKAIPIQQFTTDVGAVRQVLSYLKKGDSVLIFPEGQRSVDGSMTPYSPKLMRFAEKGHAAIVTARIQGAYQVMPRWRRRAFRLGKVKAEIKLLCRAEDLVKSGWQAYAEPLQQAIAQNDNAWAQAENRHYFGLHRVDGLANVIHRCPVCGRVEAMSQAGAKNLRCRYCQMLVPFRSNYSFSYPQTDAVAPGLTTVDAWHAWQAALEDLADESVAMPCRYLFEDGRQGNGTFTVQKEHCRLRDEATDLDLTWTQKLPTFLRCSHGEFFQFNRSSGFLRIFPENPYLIIRMVDYFSKAGLGL